MKWQDREQEPRFGGGGHRGGFNAGGYGGGYPRGGYMGSGGSGSHGDTAGRQVYVGNVFPTSPPKFRLDLILAFIHDKLARS